MKTLKTAAIAFLISSILLPAKVGLSATVSTDTASKTTDAATDVLLDFSEVNIVTPLDKLINPNPLSSMFSINYPTTAVIQSPVKLQLEALIPILSPFLCDYTIDIEGQNNYKIGVGASAYLVKDRSDDNTWRWTPDQVGIFNIVAYHKNKVAAVRKVYVNSSQGSATDKGYLQLGDFVKSKDSNNNSTISTSIADKPSTYDKNPGQIKFVVGEPFVWSRTIRPYSGVNYISESRDGFNFNNGIYNITAFLKGINSIDYEDVKATTYEESGLSNLNLTMDPPKESGNKYTFTANADIGTDHGNTKKDLLYAFILWDKDGFRLVKDYSKDNTFDFRPAVPGKYKIYARVKQAIDPKNPPPQSYLPNSYEAEVSQPLDITDCFTSSIKINSTTINAYNTTAASNNTNSIGYEVRPCKPGYAASHEINYINVSASGGIGLLYKAYVQHDGYMYPLCDYGLSNTIPFYPKSSGLYKLIVLVKSPSSGSENARREIDLTAADINTACQ